VSPDDNPLSLLGCTLVVIGAAGSDPVVDLRNLELPEPADPMSWETATIDPPVDRILGNAQVSGDVIDRRPRLCHLLFVYRFAKDELGTVYKVL
jgi:hypothetical protein